MNNRYPLWKYLLLAVVLVTGILFALPNLYSNVPAIQVSPRGADLPANVVQQIEQVLKEANLDSTSIKVEGQSVITRFADTEVQQQARTALQVALGADNTVAMNLVSSSPEWLSAFAKPMYLGLDLRGGVHFLLQVDMGDVIRQKYESFKSELRNRLREEKLKFNGVTASVSNIEIRLRDTRDIDAIRGFLGREYRDLEISSQEREGVTYLVGVLKPNAIVEEKREALKQNIITLRNRVNELGVAEPVIQQQGLDRIVVQLPGVQDTARAKDILGATATLEYRLVEGTPGDWASAASGGAVPAKARLYKRREDESPILLNREVIVTGDQITGASAGIDTQSGTPAVFVDLDGKGASRMQRVTADNVGNPMAVVFIEQRSEYKEINGEIKRIKRRVEEVINVATINDVLSNRFQTTGLESQEASNLALLLRAGSLKAPVEIVEERTVGPSLGKDNIDQGFNSVILGFSVVLVFMVFYYKVFGIFANIALTANLILIVAVLSLLQATLTLPGIAGIVLTVGMAVDANVLIFERIREELRSGTQIQMAIAAGYEKAFSTIADANITTLIASVVLFSLGTGPIKGFAITLSIGILTSMFTAIMGTRALVSFFYGGKRLERLPI